MKWKKFLNLDKRKMTLFFLLIFILIMFHIVLFVLVNTPGYDFVYSISQAYIFIPKMLIELLIQNPLLYGTPLWLVTFYLLTAIYLYFLSYFVVRVYDKVWKK